MTRPLTADAGVWSHPAHLACTSIDRLTTRINFREVRKFCLTFARRPPDLPEVHVKDLHSRPSTNLGRGAGKLSGIGVASLINRTDSTLILP